MEITPVDEAIHAHIYAYLPLLCCNGLVYTMFSHFCYDAHYLDYLEKPHAM